MEENGGTWKKGHAFRTTRIAPPDLPTSRTVRKIREYKTGGDWKRGFKIDPKKILKKSDFFV